MTNNLPKSKDPLHGIKLKQILEHLVDSYGWDELGQLVEINCFINNPSMGSSLKFLRRNPWARSAVEKIYLECIEQKNA